MPRPGRHPQPIDPASIPCESCGVAVTPPPPPPPPKPYRYAHHTYGEAARPAGPSFEIPRDTKPKPDPVWLTCPVCTAATRTANVTDAAAALLRDLLHLEDDPRAQAIRRVARELLPRASRLDRFGQTNRLTDVTRPTPGTGTAERWEFVTSTERDELRAAIATAHRDLTALKMCDRGPCGCCGVRLSVVWRSIEMPWPDRSRTVRWPVCDACHAAIARPSGGMWDDLGAGSRLVALALGITARVTSDLSTTDDDKLLLVPYAATVNGPPSRVLPGCSTPFGYVSGHDLEAVRRYTWRWHPKYAPIEVRRRHERVAAAKRSMAASTPTPVVNLPEKAIS